MQKLSLLEVLEQEEPLAEQKFEKIHFAEADAILKKLKTLEGKKQVNNIYLAEVQIHVSLENQKLEQVMRYWANVLYAFLRDSNEKTIKLRYGTVRKRDIEKWSYPDDSVLLAFAEEHCPEIIKIIQEVPKNELKKFVKDTGLMPEGLEITKEESFSYNLSV